MTENEYCNVSDLQILRVVSSALDMVNAFEQPNKDRLKSVRKTTSLMMKSLQQEWMLAHGWVETDGGDYRETLDGTDTSIKTFPKDSFAGCTNAEQIFEVEPKDKIIIDSVTVKEVKKKS